MAKSKKEVVTEENVEVQSAPEILQEVVVKQPPQILQEVVDPLVDAYRRTQPPGSIATNEGWVDANTGELLVAITNLKAKLG